MRKNNEQKMLKFIEKEFQFKDIMDNRIIKSSKKVNESDRFLNQIDILTLSSKQ